MRVTSFIDDLIDCLEKNKSKRRRANENLMRKRLALSRRPTKTTIMTNKTCLVFLITFLTIISNIETVERCVNSSNEFSYLFVDDFSQKRFPFAPFDCSLCQKADKVSRLEI